MRRLSDQRFNLPTLGIGAELLEVFPEIFGKIVSDVLYKLSNSILLPQYGDGADAVDDHVGEHQRKKTPEPDPPRPQYGTNQESLNRSQAPPAEMKVHNAKKQRMGQERNRGGCKLP